jgi:hypothetical protein
MTQRRGLTDITLGGAEFNQGAGIRATGGNVYIERVCVCNVTGVMLTKHLGAIQCVVHSGVMGKTINDLLLL